MSSAIYAQKSRFRLKLYTTEKKTEYWVDIEEESHQGKFNLYRGSKNIALIVYKNVARDLQLCNMWQVSSGSATALEMHMIFEWCGSMEKLLECTEESYRAK